MTKLLAWTGVVGPAIRLSLIVMLGYLTPGYSQARRPDVPGRGARFGR